MSIRNVQLTERLLVVVTENLADGGRHQAAIASGIALSALSQGTDLHLFLSLKAAVLSTPVGAEAVQAPGFSEPLARYIDHSLRRAERKARRLLVLCKL